MSTKEWVASIVGALLTIGFGFWLTTTNAKMNKILTEVNAVGKDVAVIKSKVQRNETDIKELRK